MVREPCVEPRGCQRVVASMFSRTDFTPSWSRNSASSMPTGPAPTMATEIVRFSDCCMGRQEARVGYGRAADCCIRLYPTPRLTEREAGAYQTSTFVVL